MQKYFWIQVTADKYELPLVVEESAGALALKIGRTKALVIDSFHKGCINRKTKTKIVRIEKGEEDI